MLFDIWDLARGNYIKMKWLLEDLRGSRQLVVHYVFYRTCQFMLGLFTAATAAVRLTKVNYLGSYRGLWDITPND